MFNAKFNETRRLKPSCKEQGHGPAQATRELRSPVRAGAGTVLAGVILSRMSERVHGRELLLG